jgi:hypothetical protein
MTMNEQGAVSLSLKGLGMGFQVATMVLAGEISRLPVLLVMVTPDQDDGRAPDVGAGPYTLRIEKNGVEPTRFGVTSWFVQSVATLMRPQQRPLFFLRLGALPGQQLTMKGHAVDGKKLSAVLQEVCDRFLGKRTVKNKVVGADPLLGTVVSFSETMEQFLRRMSLDADAWFLAHEVDGGTLSLHWQQQLQGTAVAAANNAPDWAAVRVAEERCAAPAAIRKFWPRSTVTNIPAPKPSGDIFTLEQLVPLPLAADSYEQTAPGTGVWQAGYYLSDNLVHAHAWPGLSVEKDDVIVAAIHVYDQNAAGDVRRLLGPLVPGMREDRVIPTLAKDASYGMVAISAKAGLGYAQSVGAIERLQIACRAGMIADALGMPAQAAGVIVCQSPQAMFATVCAWDASTSQTWAAGGAGGAGGTAKHSTEIKVCFDWSDVPVRLPYAYPMSGGEGVMFYPPCAGDRVLVLFDRLWPIVACNAHQCGDAFLPGVLRRGSDGQTLSGQRGIVVKGGMIFRTAANGDLVVHAAGNLVLRAEHDIYLDGKHLRQLSRAKDGSDDPSKDGSGKGVA